VLTLAEDGEWVEDESESLEILGINGVLQFTVNATRRIAVTCGEEAGIAFYIFNTSDQNSLKILDQRIARRGARRPAATWGRKVDAGMVAPGTKRSVVLNDNQRAVVECTETAVLSVTNPNTLHGLRLRTDAKGAVTRGEYEISGGTADRPGYKALLAAARARKFDVIVVEDISRLWRNRAEFGPRSAELEDLRVHMVTAVGDDTRRDGEGLTIQIKLAMAEHQRREASYRTRRGLDGLARAGKPTGGKAYGYRMVCVGPLEVDAKRGQLQRP
jgi:hypothetical protein